MSAENVYGVVFNIQHYSIHDGPGIRTTVFLKGCPLKCFWCQNPESQDSKPVIFFNAEKCTGCGTCKDVCPVEAIELNDDKAKVNEEECVECGTCVEECPEGALSLEE